MKIKYGLILNLISSHYEIIAKFSSLLTISASTTHGSNKKRSDFTEKEKEIRNERVESAEEDWLRLSLNT